MSEPRPAVDRTIARPSAWKRIAAVAKKYSRLITFVGASIVLLTFLVNDVWRDSVKDGTEELAQARTTYTLRADSVSMSLQIAGLTSEVEVVRAKLQGDELGMTVSGINRTLLLYRDRFSELSMSIDNLSGLARRLDVDNQTSNEIADLKSQTGALNGRFRSIGELVAHAIPRSDPASGLVAGNDSREISTAIFNFGWTMTELDRKESALAATMLQSAEKLRESRENSYRASTWIFYLLYGAGWALGLFGRIVGIDGLEAGD